MWAYWSRVSVHLTVFGLGAVGYVLTRFGPVAARSLLLTAGASLLIWIAAWPVLWGRMNARGRVAVFRSAVLSGAFLALVCSGAWLLHQTLRGEQLHPGGVFLGLLTLPLAMLTASRRWRRDRLGVAESMRERSRNALVWVGLVHGVMGMVIVLSFASQRDARYWEGQVLRYEARDRAEGVSEGGIVLVGSSSCRLWRELEEDLAPLPVVNRGFGGSLLSHVEYYLPRLVSRHRPRAIVIYSGENDLAYPEWGSAEELRADLMAVLQAIHHAQPGTPVYFLSIKPSLARWARWPEMRRANTLIEELARYRADLTFVDVATPMLTEAGAVDATLFAADQLHLNRQGYERWRAVLAPLLMHDWKVILSAEEQARSTAAAAR